MEKFTKEEWDALNPEQKREKKAELLVQLDRWRQELQDGTKPWWDDGYTGSLPPLEDMNAAIDAVKFLKNMVVKHQDYETGVLLRDVEKVLLKVLDKVTLKI
jgi:hypothetical protein